MNNNLEQFVKCCHQYIKEMSTFKYTFMSVILRELERVFEVKINLRCSIYSYLFIMSIINKK